jgi:acyl-CoA oxidase
MTAAVTGKCTEPIDTQFQAFLMNKSPRQYDIYRNEADIVAAFKDRVSHLAHKAYESRIVKKQSWTNLMIDLHSLAIAHSESILVENFYNAVFSHPNPQLNDTTRAVMKDLFNLFALTTINAKSTEFVLSGALDFTKLSILTTAIQDLMTAIRPHAVRLVDAWSIPDYLLDSALGQKDGDVYNALWRKAHLENPLNLQTFNPDYRTEEIIMGEGAERARKRMEALAQGVNGHEQRTGSSSSKL